MWLVISEPDDRPALWAYGKFIEAGLDPVEQITPEEFSYAARIIYSLDSDNSKFKFDLRDGRKIDSQDVQGILNRLSFVHSEHFGYSADTQYAIQELNAFFLGWLSSLDVPVINLPVPFGFSGKWRNLVEWTWLASNAGLPTTKYCNSSSVNLNRQYSQEDAVTVITAGGEVFGPNLPDAILDGCIKLADASKTILLGIKLLRVEGSLIFNNADPFPDIRLGGEKIIKRLEQLLTGGSG